MKIKILNIGISDFDEVIKDKGRSQVQCKKLDYLGFNRAIDTKSSNFKKLIKSIGSLKYIIVPIVCIEKDDRLAIIDGQHRLAAIYYSLLAQAAGTTFDVPIFINEKAKEGDIIDCNNVSKDWTNIDFMGSHADKGISQDCSDMVRIWIPKYNNVFKLNNIIDTFCVKASAKQPLKDNTYTIDIETGQLVFDTLLKLNHRKGYNNARVVNAVKEIIKKGYDFNIDNVINNIDSSLVFNLNNKRYTINGLLELAESADIHRSRYITSSLRDEVFERDGGICQYPGCGSDENIEYDHKKPFCDGGDTTLDNLQLLCRTHNRIKGSKK